MDQGYETTHMIGHWQIPSPEITFSSRLHLVHELKFKLLYFSKEKEIESGMSGNRPQADNPDTHRQNHSDYIIADSIPTENRFMITDI